MDRLAPELNNIILSYVPSKDLFRYVTVSRQWQYTIELETFQSVKFKSTELDYFARLYTLKRRRAVLRFIEYEIRLPEYPLWKCTKFEKQSDRDANNEAFTKAIVDLFKLLNSWETADGARTRIATPIKLIMSVTCGSDDPQGRQVDGDLRENRWLDSVLKLLRPDDVKPVKRVTEFYWPEYIEESYPEEPNMRDIDAAAIAAVAARLPRLERTCWSLRDRDFPGIQPRYHQRQGTFFEIF
jgi:hypothetical protein